MWSFSVERYKISTRFNRIKVISNELYILWYQMLYKSKMTRTHILFS